MIRVPHARRYAQWFECLHTENTVRKRCARNASNLISCRKCATCAASAHRHTLERNLDRFIYNYRPVYRYTTQNIHFMCAYAINTHSIHTQLCTFVVHTCIIMLAPRGTWHMATMTARHSTHRQILCGVRVAGALRQRRTRRNLRAHHERVFIICRSCVFLPCVAGGVTNGLTRYAGASVYPSSSNGVARMPSSRAIFNSSIIDFLKCCCKSVVAHRATIDTQQAHRHRPTGLRHKHIHNEKRSRNCLHKKST